MTPNEKKWRIILRIIVAILLAIKFGTMAYHQWIQQDIGMSVVHITLVLILGLAVIKSINQYKEINES